MDEQSKSIPLQGEVLIEGVVAPKRDQSPDIVDAEFEVVRNKSDNSPRENRTAESRKTTSTPENPARPGMEILRSGGIDRKPERGGLPLYLAGLALAAMAFWVSGGHAMFGEIRPIESTAADTSMLRLAGIETQNIGIGSKNYVLVSGHVKNEGTNAAASPPVSIVITDKAGQVSRYRLGSNPTLIGAGEMMPFSSRIDAPASGVGSVMVTLAAKSRS